VSSLVELFAGAGGLTLGLHRAGFQPLQVVERDPVCVETLNLNKNLLGVGESIEPRTAEDIDWAAIPRGIDLLAGGVPCQPFSFGGAARGHSDSRNAFPHMLRGIRIVEPKVVLVENVKGLASRIFETYLEYLQLRVEMPNLGTRSGETWRSHLKRLRRVRQTYAKAGELGYAVSSALLQATDYGVPQLRERLFIVGIRNDLGASWRPPISKYGEDRLLFDQYVSDAYWVRHRLRSRQPRTELVNRVSVLQAQRPRGRPWRTVRDALADIRCPAAADDGTYRHWLKRGATSYPGHAGSSLDRPAKTIKAGVHGVPGGENMIRLAPTRVRYFSVREAARLQSFPDAYRIAGTWTDAYHQLGNAVPVRLAEAVGESIVSALAAVDRHPVPGRRRSA
jgi:DNA (cytosine-5)-methyltransferase 1